MANTVMMCGLGEVGGWVLEFLARSEGVDRIVTSERNEEWGVFRTRLADIGALYQGFSKKLEFHRNDINDIDATAKLLDEIRPNVIFNSVTIQSPRILSLTPLPKDIRDKLEFAGPSVWLPWNLLPAAKLTQAISKLGIQTHVVNIASPDVVNPALWKHFGFGPTVGAGNLDITAATVVKYVSITEGVPVHDVALYFVGSYTFFMYGPRAGVPFFLKILLMDQDITPKYDIDQLLQKWPVGLRPRVRGATAIYSDYAASAVKNVMAILRDTNEYTHAPAPKGLPGGYPVRLSARGAEVVLPKELTLEQAIKINEDGNKFGGVEKIKDDGTIIYTDKTYSIMKELGYDCKQLPFDELESRSEELKILYKKLAAGGTN